MTDGQTGTREERALDSREKERGKERGGEKDTEGELEIERERSR